VFHRRWIGFLSAILRLSGRIATCLLFFGLFLVIILLPKGQPNFCWAQRRTATELDLHDPALPEPALKQPNGSIGYTRRFEAAAVSRAGLCRVLIGAKEHRIA